MSIHVMIEHRKSERFACSRTVQVWFFNGYRCFARHTAIVNDISAGGLLLQFERPVPPCTRIEVRSKEHVVTYQIRHTYNRDGNFYAGVQVVLSDS